MANGSVFGKMCRSITLAGEEFFRYFMPLTHIGRVCPVATEVHGQVVPAGGRVSLGYKLNFRRL